MENRLLYFLNKYDYIKDQVWNFEFLILGEGQGKEGGVLDIVERALPSIKKYSSS